MDNESSENEESILQDGSSEPRSLPLEYLRKITNNFSNGQLLGVGGFGKVYKGVRQNGECIAVKKLDQLATVQKPQFENEVYHLMRLNHPNIVRFVGYCYETRNECVFHDGKYVFAEIPQKLVCLEYLPNGSLDRHVSDESSGLGWYTRHRIIRGICFGLHYLHEECKSQFNASIIHLDLKPANILLDDNMVPKIADFGLSKLFDTGKTQTRTTSPAGSLGYMAPEYIYQRTISTKADIYSLGAIIIEVITGCMFGPSGIETLFCTDFVEPVLKNWRNRLKATPRFTSPETDCQQIEICLEIGLRCTNFDPEKRPTTTEIIEMLNRCENANQFKIKGHNFLSLLRPREREVVQDLVTVISNEDLEDLQEMGSGAFGTVFHGRWRGTDVAIKRIKNSCFMYSSSETDKLIAEFWREAAILSKLHHPNVLAFYGIVNNGPGGTLATVTEFMASGSLKKVLLHKQKVLDWRKQITLAMDAAIGMEYLHSKDIIHFDLKCDNLLVNLNDPSRPICKVSDFGLSKVKQTTMASGGMRETLPWMAPEMLEMNSNMVSTKVDVYSFGIIMWEILTGQEPYAGMHHGGVIGGILSNTLRPPVPASCDPQWKELMEQCWSDEPEKRPSFEEIVSHLRSMLEANQSRPLI